MEVKFNTTDQISSTSITTFFLFQQKRGNFAKWSNIQCVAHSHMANQGLYYKTIMTHIGGKGKIKEWILMKKIAEILKKIIYESLIFYLMIDIIQTLL